MMRQRMLIMVRWGSCCVQDIGANVTFDILLEVCIQQTFNSSKILLKQQKCSFLPYSKSAPEKGIYKQQFARNFVESAFLAWFWADLLT